MVVLGSISVAGCDLYFPDLCKYVSVSVHVAVSGVGVIGRKRYGKKSASHRVAAFCG